VLLAIASMWNLLAGFGGMVSIGQQAYIGIGAYTVIVLADAGIDPYMAVAFAVILAALFSWVTSWLAFRLRGDYFAVGTWVIAEVYRLIVVKIDALGGPSGRPLTGMPDIDRALRAAMPYWTALAVAVLLCVICYTLLCTSVALALAAMRTDSIA